LSVKVKCFQKWKHSEIRRKEENKRRRRQAGRRNHNPLETVETMETMKTMETVNLQTSLCNTRCTHVFQPKNQTNPSKPKLKKSWDQRTDSVLDGAKGGDGPLEITEIGCIE